MALDSQELEPESRFRLALKRLIGATTEEETKEAVLDLEEALRLILEKRDQEWQVLLHEKGTGAPSYAPNLKSFASDLAREVSNAVDAKIDAKVAAARLPRGPTTPGVIPSNIQQQLDSINEQVTHLREIVKGELAPEVREALKKEVRSSIADHMAGDDELSRLIADVVKELKEGLLAELKEELTTEVKEAIKDEIKKEIKRELL